MRHPSGILLLLACALAAPSLIHRGRAQDLCWNEAGAPSGGVLGGLMGDSASACTAITPEPEWMKEMEFLAVACFVGGAISGTMALRERRLETELLRRAAWRSSWKEVKRD